MDSRRWEEGEKMGKKMVNGKWLTVNGKRGMLLASETLKLIIAMLCIGFLVYFLGALYFTSSGGQEKQVASDLMERIQEVFASLDAGNNTEGNLSELTPEGWMIISYTEEDDVIPNVCVGKNCLCICDEVLVDASGILDRQVSECDESGVCEVTPNLMELPDIEIEGSGSFTSIRIYSQGSFVGVEEI